MLCAASAGSQLGATATRYVDPARIRILYGVTVLSGSVAVALKQISEMNSALNFLSSLAAIVLLGVALFMCAIITILLIRAKRNTSAV